MGSRQRPAQKYPQKVPPGTPCHAFTKTQTYQKMPRQSFKLYVPFPFALYTPSNRSVRVRKRLYIDAQFRHGERDVPYRAECLVPEPDVAQVVAEDGQADVEVCEVLGGAGEVEDDVEERRDVAFEVRDAVGVAGDPGEDVLQVGIFACVEVAISIQSAIFPSSSPKFQLNLGGGGLQVIPGQRRVGRERVAAVAKADGIEESVFREPNDHLEGRLAALPRNHRVRVEVHVQRDGGVDGLRFQPAHAIHGRGLVADAHGPREFEFQRAEVEECDRQRRVLERSLRERVGQGLRLVRERRHVGGCEGVFPGDEEVGCRDVAGVGVVLVLGDC